MHTTTSRSDGCPGPRVTDCSPLRGLLLCAVVTLSPTVASASGTPFQRGDVNGDRSHDVSDPVSLLLWLFLADGVDVTEPLDALDVNDDGMIDVSDAVYELQFLFTSGQAPAAPFEAPGFDPTPDDPYLDGDPFVPDPIHSGPDLAPKSLALDAQNYLQFTLASEGREELPGGVGIVSVHVDGRTLRRYRLADITDASFRSPGGLQTVTTDLRLAGELRRVSVRVDADNEIEESNEFQNTISRTLAAPALAGPDLSIAECRLDASDELEVVIRNVGPESAPAGLDLTLVLQHGEELQHYETPLDAPLGPGETRNIAPEPAIRILDTTVVRVELQTNDPLAELDNTRNARRQTLPDGPDLAPYEQLLASDVASSLIWQHAGGVDAYRDWSASQRSDLQQALRAREEDAPAALDLPPALVGGSTISADDAWSIFLEHVAQSLWVEVHGLVPWSLEDLRPQECIYLLDGRRLFTYSAGTNTYRFDTSLMGAVTAWNPRIAYSFLDNFGIVGDTQEETILALTDWMRGHLIHTSAADVFSEQFGYPGLPPVDRVLYALEGKRHKTAGCWGTTGLYAAVLRSVNVPVLSARMLLNNGNHSRPEFPTVDLSMPHGDNPYTTVLYPSGAAIPSSELFYSTAEMTELFFAPELDCDGADCNTRGEQASYNMGKDLRRIAFAYRGDYLLYEYAVYGPDYLNDSLRGSRVGGEVQEFAHPFFEAEERAAIVAEVENVLETLGDGDLEAGKTVVRIRYGRFGGNK